MDFVEEIVWMGRPLSYIVRRELTPIATTFLTPPSSYTSWDLSFTPRAAR